MTGGNTPLPWVSGKITPIWYHRPMEKKHTMISLGNRIREARKQAGLTQEELAERIGVSRTAISRFELGEIEPSLRNLSALAESLNVSADRLLGLPRRVQEPLPELSHAALQALNLLLRELQKGGNP